MAIFSRRRIQSMITDLTPFLEPDKIQTYIELIESKKTKQSISHEVELGLIWAIKKFDEDARIEPEGYAGKKLIDAFSPKGFGGAPSAIEIRAISDDTMAGQKDIDRAANIIVQFCNKIRPGSGKRMSFYFCEHMNRSGRWLDRRPYVTKDYILSEIVEAQLISWLNDPKWPRPKRLKVEDNLLRVYITVNDFSDSKIYAQSSVPKLIYHPTKNPLFRALEDKSKQMKSVPKNHEKWVILFDAGCQILSELNKFARPNSELEPGVIISSARRRFKLDGVVVISVDYKGYEPFRGDPSSGYKFGWRYTLFAEHDRKVDAEQDVATLVQSLPPARTTGDSARQLHEQGFFNPKNNRDRVSSHITSQLDGSMTMRVSSRTVLEYLAGKIDYETFTRSIFGRNANIFQLNLDSGLTIQSINLRDGGDSEDDDWIVFEFTKDAAASEIKRT